MSYLYASNVDSLDRRDQLEFQLDDGTTAILRLGHYYDLSANELVRARRYIVLTSSATPADEEPIGVRYLPIKGNPATGDIPVWDEADGSFAPQVGVGYVSAAASPNGHYWTLATDDSGRLVTTDVGTIPPPSQPYVSAAELEVVESSVGDVAAGTTIVRASGGDDLAAINAALVLANVHLPDPLYLISGEVAVPNLHDLTGSGMETTKIRPTAAGGRITFTGRGGTSGSFYFDGNAVGTNAVRFECTEREFESIRAVNCLGDIFQIGTLNATAQNNKLTNVKGHNSGGDVWSIDGGSANNDFFGCYAERSAGWLIHSKRSGASPSGGGTQPFSNRFHGGIFERPATVAPLTVTDGLGCVACTAGADLIFKGTNLSISAVTTVDLPMVLANLSDAGANTSRVHLESCTLDGNAGTSTGLKAANGGSIICTGRGLLRNCLYGYDFDDSSTIFPDRQNFSGLTNTYRARGTKTQDAQVRDLSSYPREVRRPATTDTILAARLDADAGWRFLLKADGRLLKGPGTSFTESTLAEVPVSASFGHPEGFFALSSPGWFGSTLVLVSGTWYGMRFTAPVDFTSTAIGFRVTTPSATDDPMEVTVHNTSGTRLATSGSTTGKLNGAGGLQSVPLAQAFVAGTTYYIGFVATSTATLAAFALNNAFGGRFFGDTLSKVDSISLAAWGIGNASTVAGFAFAGSLPGLTVLR